MQENQGIITIKNQPVLLNNIANNDEKDGENIALIT